MHLKSFEACERDSDEEWWISRKNAEFDETYEKLYIFWWVIKNAEFDEAYVEQSIFRWIITLNYELKNTWIMKN